VDTDLPGDGIPDSADSADEIDPGEPVQILAELGAEPAPVFLDRIRSAIHRRILASDLTDLSWSAPLQVLLEYLKMALEIFYRPERGEGERE
jgi:hypothetical protein